MHHLDFSITLAVYIPQSNHNLRLRRYNGNSHEHTSSIERITFRDFRIHRATECHQNIGTQEDGYAEPTDRYNTWHDALQCMVNDSNIDALIGPQQTLFHIR